VPCFCIPIVLCCDPEPPVFLRRLLFGLIPLSLSPAQHPIRHPTSLRLPCSLFLYPSYLAGQPAIGKAATADEFGLEPYPIPPFFCLQPKSSPPVVTSGYHWRRLRAARRHQLKLSSFDRSSSSPRANAPIYPSFHLARDSSILMNTILHINLTSNHHRRLHAFRSTTPFAKSLVR
jgi:hypothetical protein